MPTEKNLDERMQELGRKIDEAHEKIRLQHVLFEEHGPTAADLRKRYELLRKRSADEVAEDESHGHHVTELERSFRAWMDRISFDD